MSVDVANGEAGANKIHARVPDNVLEAAKNCAKAEGFDGPSPLARKALICYLIAQGYIAPGPRHED
jgi:hypothetical protein